MDFSHLERRRDARIQAFVPIQLVRQHDQQEVPAQLVDLSACGAGILTTAGHAPAIGDLVNLRFETPTSDGGTESRMRREAGVIMNLRRPERDVCRLGIRFLQMPEMGRFMIDPVDLLTHHRQKIPAELRGRWGGALPTKQKQEKKQPAYS